MKIQLGKTPEDLEKERSAKIRAMEAEVQQASLERQAKIQAMHVKQRNTKIIVIIVFVLLCIALITFGIYNTFINHLDQKDVNATVNTSVNTYDYYRNFPTAGLDNYVRDNAEALFNKYAKVDMAKYEYMTLDKNSVYISNIKIFNNHMADVYFCADVTTKEVDTVVTDEAIITALKNGGFIQEETTEETPTATSTDATMTDATQEPTTEEVTTDENNTDVEVIPGSVEYQKNSKETVEYYIGAGGEIKQKGATHTRRFCFYVPIEYYFTHPKDKDGNEVSNVTATEGYRLMSDLTLYSLVSVNQTDFEDIVDNTEEFSFQSKTYGLIDNTRVEGDEATKIQSKVNNTLDGLYNHRDTSEDFHSFYEFNTYDATYKSLDNFEMWSKPNHAGFNAHITYTIETPEGITISVNNYLLIEPNGSSWVISKIL